MADLNNVIGGHVRYPNAAPVTHCWRWWWSWARPVWAEYCPDDCVAAGW